MFDYLFDTEGFPARWYCGTAWAEEPWIGWLHIVADLATFLAYLAIPVLMLVALRRSRHAPAPRLLTLFALFILACGTVHLLEVIIFWMPVYRLSAIVKALTAVVSCLTAGMLAVYLPKLLTYRSPDDLQTDVDEQTARLAEANDALELALAAGSMGAWDWNLDTDQVRFDRSWLALTGLSPHARSPRDDPYILAREFFERVHPGDRPGLESVVDEVITSGAEYDHAFRFTTPEGKTKWLAGRGRLVIDPGKPRRFIGVNYDITSQKQVEAELAEARAEAEAANQAKSRFLANTSHEIRTPLTAILGCAELLERSTTDPGARETASQIRRQSQLLQRLLNDVLDLSKIEADRLTIQDDDVLDVESLLEDLQCLLEPLASEKRLACGVRRETEAPRYLKADSLRVRQILINLVANAIKFTKKGRVDLVVSLDPKAPGEVCFAVTDTGVGIKAEDQLSIFDAFHQLKASDSVDGSLQGTGGVGLGLAISSRLAGMLGGRIELSSTPSSGSTFRLYLPERIPSPSEIAAEGAAPLRRVTVVYSDPTPTGRLLVAEDTPSIQFLLKRLLAPYAQTLTIVADGREALSRIDEAIAAGEPYDALLLDMNLPEVSGYDVAKRLRQAGHSLPIIAITASAMADDERRCLDSGCSAYLSKPIDSSRLDEEMRRVLSAAMPS